MSACKHNGGRSAGWFDSTTWVEHCTEPHCGALLVERKGKAPADAFDPDPAADAAYDRCFGA